MNNLRKNLLEEYVGKDKIRGKEIRLNRQRLQPIKGEDYAAFVAFGDLHYGLKECDIVRAKRMLDYCLAKNTYVLLMGDLMECGIKSSVGRSIYQQKLSPGEQLEAIIELFKPLAEKGLILGSLMGNHEDRILKLTGVNVIKIFCKTLDIPYLGDACWNLFYAGNQSYTVYALHGRSGSRFVYTKLKAAVDIAHTFDADLLLMGHVHELTDDFLQVQSVDKTRKKVIEKKRFIVLTGHYVGYDRSYAQMKGYPISKLGSPKIKLYTKKWDLHVSY